MAVRLNARHSESCLKRIRTSQLLNRVQEHALGKLTMQKTELQAACFLIERTLAKAEAPKDINLNAQVTLVDLIQKANKRE